MTVLWENGTKHAPWPPLTSFSTVWQGILQGETPENAPLLYCCAGKNRKSQTTFAFLTQLSWVQLLFAAQRVAHLSAWLCRHLLPASFLIITAFYLLNTVCLCRSSKHTDTDINSQRHFPDWPGTQILMPAKVFPSVRTLRHLSVVTCADCWSLQLCSELDPHKESETTSLQRHCMVAGSCYWSYCYTCEKY